MELEFKPGQYVSKGRFIIQTKEFQTEVEVNQQFEITRVHITRRLAFCRFSKNVAKWISWNYLKNVAVPEVLHKQYSDVMHSKQ
jgi:hypothetical protein